MENASKALEMAAGVLIALLVLSLGVLLYNRVTQLKKTEEDTKAETQAADFNKQFEVYNKNGLYGSELLSLANLAIDYNTREASKGYKELNVVVKFIDIDDAFRKYFGTSTTLNQDKISSGYTKMSSDIISAGKVKISNKTVQEWSKVSENTITASLSATDKAKVVAYKDLINEQAGIGRKLFNLNSSNPVKYDSNGRIIEMSFIEISTK